jgi:hypothetical protein
LLLGALMPGGPLPRGLVAAAAAAAAAATVPLLNSPSAAPLELARLTPGGGGTFGGAG